ncbi:MAG: hypothetical protein ACLUG3_04900 [Bacilli bacterium]
MIQIWRNGWEAGAAGDYKEADFTMDISKIKENLEKKKNIKKSKLTQR